MGIELKTTRFDPRDAGQLGFYVALVDDRLRIRDKHQPTVGILLVASAQLAQAEAHLRGSEEPRAVKPGPLPRMWVSRYITSRIGT